ncbi:MAG: hypothetical protein EOP84_29600, partial [Verrucomicrobiaceae bacterium]
MLSALAPQHLQSLFEKRIPLKIAVLGADDAHWRGEAIATPPGVGVPGLIGVEDDAELGTHHVIRVDFKAGEEVAFCPLNLQWKEGEPLAVGALRPCTAPLETQRLLRPREEGSPLPPNVLHWLAAAYTALARTSSSDKLCVATGVNILGPDIGDVPTNATWQVLGYAVDASRLRGQAFIRRGRGLMLEPVADQHDHLWRTGTALADFLGRLDVSRSMISMRFSAQAHVSESGTDWAVEAMLRFSLTRLRGWSYPSKGIPLADRQFPATIERVLARLKSFPVGVDDVEYVRYGRIAHLVATLAEGRALHARAECDFDFTLPGGAAALLVDLT